MSKIASLTEVIASIPDGTSIALGGNTFHRAPGAMLHELVRQGKKDLTLIKTAGAYDIDLLVGAGSVETAVVAYVGFETMGMAPRYRKALETGVLRLIEHT